MKHENPEVEAAVLGALLDATGPILRTSATQMLDESALGSEDMTTAAHKSCLQSIQALSSRAEVVTPQSVWAIAKGMPGMGDKTHVQLNRIRGTNTCTLEAFVGLVHELKRLTSLRRLVEFHKAQLIHLSEAKADAVKAAGELETFAATFSVQGDDFYRGSRDQFELAEEWEAHLSGRRAGVLPTGIEALDEVVGGWAENLNVLGGASSVGKSSFVATSVLSALKGKHTVAVFGLEDGTRWIGRRFVSRATGIPVGQVGRSRQPEYKWDLIQSAHSDFTQLQENMLGWAPRGGERLRSDKLVSMCRMAIQKHKARAIFVDHGLEIEHVGEKGEELRHKVDRTFSHLRSLAHTSHTPIVVVVHFNRVGAMRDGPPRQEDFAECAGIERMSRLSLGLWTSPDDAPNEIRCSVMKHTEGRRRVHLLLTRDVEAAMLSEKGGRELDNVEGKAKPKPSWAVNEAA